jgi:hypothetical protein
LHYSFDVDLSDIGPRNLVIQLLESKVEFWSRDLVDVYARVALETKDSLMATIQRETYASST